MVGTMNEQKISGYFKDKSILITGSTGFLGKLLVEKILRVQSDVKKIYLPVRAADAAAAQQRVETEVVGSELFGLVRQKHGDGFESFMRDKIVPLAGDVTLEDFGVHEETLKEELDVIVNVAATTSFYERYDVALDVNVLGVKHMCNFANKCPNLKVLLHVSTAYVAGENQGLVQERPFRYGETLCNGPPLDIDTELNLARELKKQMETDCDMDPSPQAQRKAMKDLGLTRARYFGWPNTYVFTKSMGEMMIGQLLKGEFPVVIVRPSIITSVHKDPLPGWIEGARSIHAVLIRYIKQNQTWFIADPDLTADVIPGDMVVNAMITTMVVHAYYSLDNTSKSHLNPSFPAVYHVSTSLSHPVQCSVLYKAMLRYFKEHPVAGPNGRIVPTRKIRFIRSIFLFRLFMVLWYRIPIELLHLISILLCGLFGLNVLYHDLIRNYSHAMQLVDLYGPFALFKGRFDDINLNRLRLRLTMDSEHGGLFNFNPKTIDWDDYFYRIHIPGIMKMEK
ncbi:hypothetical protein ZWY2020_051269 [Hordeum vulgare]|nr:hypothetical protein ZWY2020_051269 [Hordeum vulgare]